MAVDMIRPVAVLLEVGSVRNESLSHLCGFYIMTTVRRIVAQVKGNWNLKASLL